MHLMPGKDCQTLDRRKLIEYCLWVTFTNNIKMYYFMNNLKIIINFLKGCVQYSAWLIEKMKGEKRIQKKKKWKYRKTKQTKNQKKI